jgi:hypothetical protein
MDGHAPCAHYGKAEAPAEYLSKAMPLYSTIASAEPHLPDRFFSLPTLFVVGFVFTTPCGLAAFEGAVFLSRVALLRGSGERGLMSSTFFLR